MAIRKNKFMNFIDSVRITTLAVVLVGMTSISGVSFASDDSDESISDSVVNIWDKVSDAAVKGGRIVKEKSVEVGKEVGDKSVEAWNWATDDDSEPEEMKEGAFGDDSLAIPGANEKGSNDPETPGAPPVPQMEKKKSESMTSSVGSSAAELWGRVAEAFSSDESEDGSTGYPDRAELWDEINIDLDEIAQKLQKQDSLPADSLFGEDRDSNRKKIDKMLTEVLEVLEVSNVSDRKQEYADLEEEIREKNTDIIALREKMVVAPVKVEGVDKVWKNTVEDYKSKIAASEAEIADLKVRQKNILATIKSELLERSGIKLSDDQVYSLVVMVSGDSFITLNSIFYNIKQLVGILEELAESNQDYINTIKKYYGMYAVLVEALKLSHEVEIDKIKNDYLPKINEYRVRAQIASKDTKALIAKNQENPANLAMLKNNLRAQAEVYTAAGAYGQYLSDYLVSLESSKREIESQLVIVMDTWRTTQLASGLLAVMKSSSSGLKDLVSMELPSIKPLNIGRLKDQFSMISMELRD